MRQDAFGLAALGPAELSAMARRQPIGRLRHFHVVHPLQRDGDLPRNGLQQLLLLRRQGTPGPRRRGRGSGLRVPGRRRHGRLRVAGDGSEQTCADKQCPDHFFASCGGGAGGLFPGGGAFFKNSHQAASPTSSEPKNSKRPSSGGGGGVDAGVEAGGGAGGVGGAGGTAFAAAHSAPNNSQLLVKPLITDLRSGTRIRGLVREIIEIDIVLQHLHGITRTFVR